MPRFVALTGGVTGKRLYVNPETVAKIEEHQDGCAITFVSEVDDCIYVSEPIDEVLRLLTGDPASGDANFDEELLSSIVASWSEEGLAALAGIVGTPEEGFGTGEDGPRLFRARALELRALLRTQGDEMMRLRRHIEQANAHIRVLMGEAETDA